MNLQANILKTILITSILLAGLSLPLDSPAQERQAHNRIMSVGLGFDYATGKYGTDIATDFISVPLIIDWYPSERLDFELQIPFVYQSNSNTVFGSAMPYRNRFGASMAGVTSARFGPGSGSGSGSGSTSSSTSSSRGSSHSGLGDITLSGGFVVIPDEGWQPRLRPIIYLKFPTANSDIGLGTGEFEGGGGLELSKWLGNWYLFGEASYIFQGSSDIYPTKNYLAYSGGLGYQWTEDLYLAVLAKGATNPAEGSPPLFEGRMKLTYQLSAKTGLEGYLAKGVTDGSPDFGAGLALFVDL